ncbi:MAG: hypothetical protein WAK39_19920, partial [Pseudolabrys sp.]
MPDIEARIEPRRAMLPAVPPCIVLNNSLGDGAGAGKNQPQSDMGKFPIFSIIISDLLQSS